MDKTMHTCHSRTSNGLPIHSYKHDPDDRGVCRDCKLKVQMYKGKGVDVNITPATLTKRIIVSV